MLFNPTESIDFNGNTGPFIQYTYARIQSILKKASSIAAEEFSISEINSKEKEIIKWIHDYPATINQAAQTQSPAIIANYVYELVKLYNQFYHDFSILKEENSEIKKFRIQLSRLTGYIIFSAMKMLGIEVPERM